MKPFFAFAGQGAQAVGMGRDLYEKYAAAKAVFDEADSVLGYSISELCFEGPAEKLTETIYCQPAIYTMSPLRRRGRLRIRYAAASGGRRPPGSILRRR